MINKLKCYFNNGYIYTNSITKKKFQLILLKLLSFLMIILIIIGIVFIRQANAKALYYNEELMPFQEKIIAFNNDITKTKKQAALIKKSIEFNIYWPAILVSLSESKPDNLSVQNLQAKKNKLKICAETTNISTAKDWQENLKKMGMFNAINITKVKHNTKGRVSFELEIEYSGKDTIHKRT